MRGPARSSQPPQIAAEQPSSTKNSVYIHCNSLIFQSQVVATMRANRPISAGHAIDSVMPSALDNGSQNTLKP